MAVLAGELMPAQQAGPGNASGIPQDCLAPILAALRRGPVAPPARGAASRCRARANRAADRA